MEKKFLKIQKNLLFPTISEVKTIFARLKIFS